MLEVVLYNALGQEIENKGPTSTIRNVAIRGPGKSVRTDHFVFYPEQGRVHASTVTTRGRYFDVKTENPTDESLVPADDTVINAVLQINQTLECRRRIPSGKIPDWGRGQIAGFRVTRRPLQESFIES